MGNKKDFWGSAALSIALTIIPMTSWVYCVLSFALVVIAPRHLDKPPVSLDPRGEHHRHGLASSKSPTAGDRSENR